MKVKEFVSLYRNGVTYAPTPTGQFEGAGGNTILAEAEFHQDENILVVTMCSEEHISSYFCDSKKKDEVKEEVPELLNFIEEHHPDSDVYIDVQYSDLGQACFEVYSDIYSDCVEFCGKRLPFSEGFKYTINLE